MGKRVRALLPLKPRQPLAIASCERTRAVMPAFAIFCRGRNDLADLKSLNVNALRMYEFKGYYSHVSFLNAAYSAGMKVRACS